MKPEYAIERWLHGWVLSGIPPNDGIPMTALGECDALFEQGSLIDTGIVHHLNKSGKNGGRNAVFCVGSVSSLKEWRKEINEELAKMEHQYRWWCGLDVGASSASIFAVFCSSCWKDAAAEMGNGSTPKDADDFGRCKRLLDVFPEWRTQLNKVAEAYPDTKWGKIVERWDEIEKSEPKKQSEVLRECHNEASTTP